MKPLLVCLVLQGVSVAAQAQAPVGSRVLTKAETKRVQWPRFERVGNSDLKPDTTDYQPEVAALQLLLRNQGFLGTKPDGIYGNGTVRAVKAFQRSKGLVVDGVVASQTMGKLCLRLKRGDRGDAVRALQTLLRLVSEGAQLKVDGVFGFSTETALRAYQKAVAPDFNLKSDGVAGARTWALLLSPEEVSEESH